VCDRQRRYRSGAASALAGAQVRLALTYASHQAVAEDRHTTPRESAPHVEIDPASSGLDEVSYAKCEDVSDARRDLGVTFI
jgi:hypothetical protein